MRGSKKRARKRVSTILVMVAAVVLIVLLGSGTAFAAPPWSDASNNWWVSTYNITDMQAGTVSDGYPDGTFRPGLAVTRAQFAKMAVEGFDLPVVNPLVATFPDVPRTNYFYQWVEGAVDEGIIGGFTDGSFRPNSSIIRQQVNSILGKYLAAKELSLRGHVAGDDGNYPSLDAWFAAEGQAILAPFADRASVATVHAAPTAYLVYHGVVEGSGSGVNRYLGPDQNVTRAQAVAMILRTKAVAFPATPPMITLLDPAFGPAAGGNTVAITGTNFTGATAVWFGTKDALSFTVNSPTRITAVAPSGTTGTTVDVRVTTPAGTSAVSAATKYSYDVPATAPSAVHLLKGTVNPVGQVTDVAIPAPGATDNTGKVMDWVPSTADRIRFTVTDGGTAVSTITINGASYTSGADYVITSTVALTIVVTTYETGRTTVVRTFLVSVNASATAPSAVHLLKGTVNPVGQVTDVAIPAPGATDNTGKVMGWAAGTADRIRFTVTDVSPAASTITINGVPYTNGADYVITSTSLLTIVVTTTETGKSTAVRTFLVSVSAWATAPSAVHLLKGTNNPVGDVVDVALPAPGGTDNTGKVAGWVAGTADRIKFTITDVSPAVSTITINGAPYISGNDYIISSANTLTIVVTTTETGKAAAVRTFTVAINVIYATVPSAVNLTPGTTNPVGGVVNVSIPGPGGTDNTGRVTGWAPGTADRIRFSVTDAGGAISTITINGMAYLSGNEYAIGSAGTLTVVVSTAETGKVTAVRTFLVTVTQALATPPVAVTLAPATTNGVGGVVNVAIPGPGGADNTGRVIDWAAGSADRIKFTVTDGGSASSTITINGASHISGNDYIISSANPLTIVVTTTEPGRLTAVRTFTVTVTQAFASTPSSVTLAPATTNPVGGVVNVAIPGPGGADNTGRVTGWVTGTADRITFAVTDVSPAVSTITINGVPYTNGADYSITSTGNLIIVVVTSETGKVTCTRSFTVAVTAP